MHLGKIKKQIRLGNRSAGAAVMIEQEQHRKKQYIVFSVRDTKALKTLTSLITALSSICTVFLSLGVLT